MIYKHEKTLSKETFQNPGSAFRGAPFWAWNTKMTKENIDYTLQALKDMGMGGGFVHCRTGMDNPYMSEEFLDLVSYSNEKSKEMDMLTWLYDEDRWPSGAGGGLVTREHKYRTRFLVFAPWRLEGRVYEGNMQSSGQAVRSEERTLLARYEICLENGYLTGYRKLEEDEMPAGNSEVWYAYLEVSGDNHWFNDQAYLNTLDKEAVEKFIEVTHEKYKETLGDEFGKSIHAIFTDEPQFCHKTCLDFAEEKMEVIIPFTDDLEETFTKAYGHSLMNALPELFWELPDGKVSRTRYQYHDHIAERFADAFADTIGSWCTENNIALTGHMMEEPTLGTQTAALGEAMRSYRSFAIPGVDMLADHKELSTAKQTQSSVHQYGREGMMSELYGVTNWDFDFRGHKLQGDWQAALGVTLRVPHLTWTSMGGEAKRDYPAAIGYQSPWYKEYPYVENYFARLNTVLTRGVPHVRVGVIHPIESYWLFWGPKEQTAAVREEMDENFLNLIRWLLFGTVDFDLIAESMLPDLYESTEKGLQVGKMNYDVILVPNTVTLRGTTLSILEEYRAKGGKVIFAGELPDYEDALPSNRGRELAAKCTQIPFSKNRILQALEPVRDVEIREKDGSRSINLIYQMREEGDSRWLFLAHVNREEQDDLYGQMHVRGFSKLLRNVDLPAEENLTIRLNGEWKLTVYDAMTGEITPIGASYVNGKTILEKTMFDQDSLLLLMEPGRREIEKEEACGKTYKDIRIPDLCDILMSEPNVSILDLAEYCFDDGEWQEEEEILRIDNIFREKLGYPLRMEALAQPWTRKKEDGFEHLLQLRHIIYCADEMELLCLAMEYDENTNIYLDGIPVPNQAISWYTDRSLRVIPLPQLWKGAHSLTLEIPYNDSTNVEAMFLLGDFRVDVEGRKQALLAPESQAAFMDLTRQGYPFYGGCVTYDIPFTSEGGDIEIDATLFRAPLMKADIDYGKKKVIAYSPYKAVFTDVPAGEHVMHLEVFGSRINTFGTLHNCNRTEFWYGPNAWRTTGDQWSYEYQLKPTGILKAPLLREIVK